MVTVQSVNLTTQKSKNLTDLQHQLLLQLNDTCIEIQNQNDLNFLRKQVILNILEICQDCAKMAALPQGAFVACKLRDQYRDRDLMVSRIKSGGDKNESKFYNCNKKLMEYSPVKYNEKLMNSIWGFYNRYSPHNIKSNEIVSYDRYFNQQQQSSAVANQLIAHNIAMTATSCMEWNFKKN
ncbi:uncharacterized protein LOC101897387 [Musca domestica]|uniref:Uncharacterized protein LOC101897387 n=1 Tax=Musca domestica TaxID=7370 RepID=A0A1I8MDG7_MUSDO|nr:uncharacterized protein LOC101897387 [Musca domestica]